MKSKSSKQTRPKGESEVRALNTPKISHFGFLEDMVVRNYPIDLIEGAFEKSLLWARLGAEARTLLTEEAPRRKCSRVEVLMQCVHDTLGGKPA